MCWPHPAGVGWGRAEWARCHRQGFPLFFLTPKLTLQIPHPKDLAILMAPFLKVALCAHYTTVLYHTLHITILCVIIIIVLYYVHHTHTILHHRISVL